MADATPDGDLEQRPRITAVIVTYNSDETIARCLRCLESSSVRPSVVVVDNASTDTTTAIVSREFPDVTMERGTQNLGFAAGCNRGIELASADDPTHFLFVNPDAFLDDTCVEVLVHALLANPRATVACPLIRDGSGRIWYAGAAAEVRSGIYWHEAVGDEDIGQFTETTVTGRPTGCVMLAQRTSVEIVGGFDPSYFLYWEDVEWGLRLQRSGKTVLFVPKAGAVHAVSTSTGGPTSKVYEYYYLRNRLRLVNETTGRSKRELVAANWVTSMRSVAALTLSRGPRAGAIAGRAILLAYVDFLRGRYGQRTRL